MKKYWTSQVISFVVIALSAIPKKATESFNGPKDNIEMSWKEFKVLIL